MNRRTQTIALLSALAAASLWCGCSGDVAGNTSETTNGVATISGAVNLPEGKPAAGVLVQLIDDEHWLANVVAGKSVVIATATTDARGRFAFATTANRCNIQIDAETLAVLARNVSKIDSVVYPTLTLAPTAAVSGSATGAPASLLLSGTSYTALPTGAAFAFPAVAGGEYTIVADLTTQTVAAASVSPAPGEQLFGEGIDAVANAILLDDCEKAPATTSLGHILGWACWYTASDEQPQSPTQVTLSAANGADADTGTSLHAAVALGDSAGSWGMAGCFFGPKTSYDLTGLATISFRFKCASDVYFSLFSAGLDSVAGNTAHFGRYITASSTWTTITIPVSSLTLDATSPAGLAGKTWADAAKTLSALRFMIYDPAAAPGTSVDLYIDNIRLEGVPLDSFSP